MKQIGEHMSQRYDIGDSNTDVEIVGPGTDLGDHELGPGRHALVIGDPWASAYAIEGSLKELREFAQRVTTHIEQAQSNEKTL